MLLTPGWKFAKQSSFKTVLIKINDLLCTITSPHLDECNDKIHAYLFAYNRISVCVYFNGKACTTMRVEFNGRLAVRLQT